MKNKDTENQVTLTAQFIKNFVENAKELKFNNKYGERVHGVIGSYSNGIQISASVKVDEDYNGKPKVEVEGEYKTVLGEVEKSRPLCDASCRMLVEAIKANLNMADHPDATLDNILKGSANTRLDPVTIQRDLGEVAVILEQVAAFMEDDKNSGLITRISEKLGEFTGNFIKATEKGFVKGFFKKKA